MSSKRNTDFSPKKKRRLITVNENWLKDDNYKDWLKKKDDLNLRCTYCNVDFTVKFEGISAINKHKESNNHKKAINSVKMSSAMSQFVRNEFSKDEEKVIIAELCLTYHSINHHHSYLSTECGIKLSQQVFSDSSICKRMHCARTKLSAIAKNVLKQHSIDLHLSELNDKLFSISTDASNKGNIKFFPIAVQYFTKTEGIKNFILDFYEDSNETSFSIYNHLKSSLEKNKLNLKNVIAFSADNASVNYGCNKSVYVNLKKENNFIVKANCNCHIVHNTAKYSLMQLHLDIENLVTKIFNHFSSSAKRRESLKSCYQFVNCEYSEILKYIQTRWLSLFPAIDRIIKNMEAIKTYFIGVGSKECDNVIIEFIWDKNDSNREFTFYELFIHFAHQFMKVFHETVLILENKSTNATDLYEIMVGLRDKIKARIEHKFYGHKVLEKIHLFSEKEREIFIKSASIAYKRAIEYLEENFEYENSVFKSFSALNLINNINYEKIIGIAKSLNLRIDGDDLFNECFNVNQILEQKDKELSDMRCVDKWCKVLSSIDSPILLKIVETVMAIPIGNDFVERVFSIMRNTLTDERNRLCVNMLRAEICTKVNFNMSCPEFNQYVKTNRKLINDAKSNDKYSLFNQNNDDDN